MRKDEKISQRRIRRETGTEEWKPTRQHEEILSLKQITSGCTNKIVKA